MYFRNLYNIYAAREREYGKKTTSSSRYTVILLISRKGLCLFGYTMWALCNLGTILPDPHHHIETIIILQMEDAESGEPCYLYKYRVSVW